MAALSIRNLDEHVRERLRLRAAEHGRSMEAEIRAILADAVREDEDPSFVDVWVDRFARLGGVELEMPDRETPVRAPDFS